MILNITAIRDKMLNPPKAQRLHQYFGGQKDKITDEQKLEVLDIVQTESDSIIAQIRHDILKH